MDSEFLGMGVWAPNFFANAKFEVKNFSEFFNLQSTVDSEFFRLGVWAPTIFRHTKFKVKNFSEFFSFIESSGF